LRDGFEFLEPLRRKTAVEYWHRRVQLACQLRPWPEVVVGAFSFCLPVKR
jgi:hypothetical protein